eukprot:TRINITY_DN4359_c0_g1_i1.p1 TRINITY_DN4359_c0_g1~~TRINITY_DN4359_c0_g1_i1.p1  ORF type:complete len:653 (-),score=213.79 TRINITY_DN4359_c0_g1_i1:29-1987(-)
MLYEEDDALSGLYDDSEVKEEKDEKDEKDEKEEKVWTVSASEMFEVYPSVAPPPEGYIVNQGDLPEDVHVGKLEVIVGPVFDISAYNDGIRGNASKGIKSQKDRGVVDIDAQYNGLNFVYFIDAGNGTYQRKMCTNRLSFYLDEHHGCRIFPDNIEGQLALLVYRDATYLKNPVTKETNQHLLAKAIKKVIPKLLKAVTGELNSDKSNEFDARFEYALRIYLAIHQVAIKLLLHYPDTYAYLYRSIIRWIQNPFAPENHREWPDVEEVLIAASLVGINWPTIREAFFRKLLWNLLETTSGMREGAPIHERLRHLFNQNRSRLYRVLYELSFFISDISLYEMDRMYTRCAGTVPLAQRSRMRSMAMAVRDVDSFDKFWVAMGMDSPVLMPHEIAEHIHKYFNYIMERIPQWCHQSLPADALEQAIQVPNLRAPPPGAQSLSVANLGILKFQSEKEKQMAAHLAAERAKHQGMPMLTSRRNLERLKCNYPLCGRTFNCRSHLMAHLRRVIVDWEDNYHKKHLAYHAPKKFDRPFCEPCGLPFRTLNDLFEHFAEVGVVGYWDFHQQQERMHRVLNNQQEIKEEAAHGVDQYDDMNTCVICLGEERQVVFIPCGHICCCEECGDILQTCPICRTRITQNIDIFYAKKKNIQTFNA